MFALLASMRVDPANEKSFEKAFGDFGRKILTEEPGTLTYCLAKCRSEAGSYRAIEIYDSEEAFKSHVAADAFQAFRPTLIGFLLEPPTSERLDVVT